MSSTKQISANNPRYGCKHCDFECTTTHFVKHLIRHHPLEFKASSDNSVSEASAKKNVPIKHTVRFTGPAGNSNQYKIYICVGCNKFYSTEDKCMTHILKSCTKKHQEGATALLTTMREKYAEKQVEEAKAKAEAESKPEGEANPTSDVPKNEIVYAKPEAIIQTVENPVNTEMAKELEKLKKEKEALEHRLSYQMKENERLKAIETDDTLKEKVEDLEAENEDLKCYHYKYERLRYVLLQGLIRDEYNTVKPFLSLAHRQKLIRVLEGNNLLPRHAEYGEDSWYDEFKGDEYGDARGILNEYKFPIDYPKEEVEEDY